MYSDADSKIESSSEDTEMCAGLLKNEDVKSYLQTEGNNHVVVLIFLLKLHHPLPFWKTLGICLLRTSDAIATSLGLDTVATNRITHIVYLSMLSMLLPRFCRKAPCESPFNDSRQSTAIIAAAGCNHRASSLWSKILDNSYRNAHQAWRTLPPSATIQLSLQWKVALKECSCVAGPGVFIASDVFEASGYHWWVQATSAYCQLPTAPLVRLFDGHKPNLDIWKKRSCSWQSCFACFERYHSCRSIK